MVAFFSRLRLRVEDIFRVFGASDIKSLIYYALHCFDRNPERRLKYSAETVTHTPRLARYVGAWRIAEKAAHETVKPTTLLNSVELNRCVVLKKPESQSERGILLVSFENELDKFARLTGFEEFEKEYQILFLPTWQPFHSMALFRFKARSSEFHGLMPSSLDKEKKFVAPFSEKMFYLPFHAGSWVRPVRNVPALEDRDIDLLMVANFGRHKRHWKLFDAIRGIDKKVKIVVAGIPMGSRDLEALTKEADLFGVRERIEFIVAPSDEIISSLLSRAKVFCAMTHKEGSYISAVEALMHGAAVVMFSNALIGSRAYINSVTGLFLDYFGHTGKELISAVGTKNPKEVAGWAANNISSEVNCVALNKMLKTREIELNNEWTRDIESFYCAHFDFYYSGEAAVESQFYEEYQRLENVYGLSIKR